jgi:hypothetical protein
MASFDRAHETIMHQEEDLHQMVFDAFAGLGYRSAEMFGKLHFPDAYPGDPAKVLDRVGRAEYIALARETVTRMPGLKTGPDLADACSSGFVRCRD